MAANEIKISIGGDAAGLIRASQQGAGALTNLGNSAQTAAKDLNLLGPAAEKAADSVHRFKDGFRGDPSARNSFQQTAAGLGDVAKNAQSAGAALRTVPVGSNQAAQSLTNLSRIAQDAPFGFIGIQNNLNPLIESFGRLKQETGSSSAAFKALLSGLAGPAGIGLALGVVTGLVTFAIQKYGSLGNAVNALMGDYDGLARANDELGKSFAEATGKAAGEQAVINSLVSVARNEALSRDARNEAINKLNKEYDEFLPKLTLENINTQEVTDSVNKLNEALLRQAKIKGVQDLIAKEFQRLTLVMTDLGESTGFVDVLKASITGMGSSVKTGTDLAARGFKNQAEAIEDAKKRISLFNNVLNELITTDAKAGTLFTENHKKGTDALKERIDQLKKLQSVAGLTTSQLVELAQLEIQLVQRDQAKLGFSKDDVQSAVDEIIRKAFPEDFKMTVFSGIEVVPVGEKPDITKALGLDQIDIGKLDESMDRVRKEAEASAKRRLAELDFGDVLQKRVDSIFENLQTDAVSGFAESIGSAIGGAIEGGDIFKALFNIIAEGAIQLGQALIAYGVALLGFQLALSSLNPVAALAAGAGLIIAGAALKAAIPKFEEGGITQGPQQGFLAMLHPNEAVIPLNKLPDVVGRLKSNDLNLTLVPSLRFDVGGMYVAIERYKGRKERSG